MLIKAINKVPSTIETILCIWFINRNIRKQADLTLEKNKKKIAKGIRLLKKAIALELKKRWTRIVLAQIIHEYQGAWVTETRSVFVPE